MKDESWNKTGNPYFDKLLKGYGDLIARWKGWVTNDCHQRFIEYTKNYLQAAIELAEYRQNKLPLSLERYLSLRKHDIGSDTLSVFIEMAKKIPDQIFDDERIKRSVEIATFNTLGTNDIASIEKDQEIEDNNWVLLLERKKKITENEAIGEIRKILEKGLEELEEIYKEVETEPAKKNFSWWRKKMNSR